MVVKHLKKFWLLLLFTGLIPVNNIYAQLYTSVTGTTFCAGGSVSVSYAVDYMFNTDNVFTVQLSSSTGSFTNPVILGQFAGRVSATVNVTTPSNTSYGTGYRIRTISSSPQINGTDNGADITINPLPTPSISGNFSPCADSRTQTYTTPSVNNMTYQWAATGGSINGSSTSTSVSITWSGSSGTVSLTETNTVTGCVASISQNIIVNPLPTPSISGSAIVCENSTATYTTTSISGHNYQWSVTNGTISGSSTNPSVDINWGSGSSGIVRVTETIVSTGCTASTTQNVTFNPQPTPNITGNFSPCINNTETYSTTNVAGHTYQWSVSGGSLIGASNTNSISLTLTATSASLTVTETITSTNCSKTVTRNFSVNPQPDFQINGNFTICSDSRTQTYSTTPQSGISYQWYVSNATINGSSTGNTVNVTWTDNIGVISLTETINSTGCQKNNSVTVYINPVPTPSISGTTSVCSGSTQSYSTPSVSGNSYQWTITGGSVNGSSTSNSVSVTWGSAGTGTVRVTETINSTGCNASDSKNITINPLPTPNISGTLVFCSDAATQTYSTPAVSGVTYLWTVTGGTIIGQSGNNSVFILWTASSGTITITETINSTGCTAFQTRNIIMNPVPNPVINGLFVLCADNVTQTYNANIQSGITYFWTVEGGTINGSSTSNILFVSWTASSGVINLTERDLATGCFTVISRNVTINPLPQPSITGNSTVCEASTATYSTQAVTGDTYQWSVTGGTINGSSTSNSVSVTWGSNSSGTVSVVETTTATGCVNSTTKSVTINPLPTPEINGILTVCVNARTQVYTTPQNAQVTYQWSVTGGSIIGSSTNYQVTVNWTSNAGTISLTEVNTSTNCTKNITKTISVNPLPNPQISGNLDVCRNRTENYSANQNSDYSYNWSVTGGAIVGSSTGSTVQITWGALGSGTITLTETINSTGCSAATASNVSITDGPNPDFTGSISVCENSTHQYTAVQGNNATYQWEVENGTINGSSTGQSVSVTWNTVNGNLRLTETNTQTGCTNIMNKTITINPLPVPQIEGNFSLCADNKTQTYSVAPDANKSYQWTITGGSINGSSTSNQVNVTWVTDGGYLNIRETYNSTGCSAADSHRVYINSLPVPTIEGKLSVCANSTENYTTPYVKDVSYQWSVTGGSINGSSTAQDVSITWTTEQGTITLLETITQTGCAATVTQNITVNPLPDFEITGSLAVCAKSEQTYSTPQVNGISYLWKVTGGTFVGDSTSNSATINWGSSTGKLKLTETVDATGCSSYLAYDVTLYTLPTPVINGPDSVCLFSYQDYSTPVLAGVSYKWKIDGGILSGGSVNSPNVKIKWTDTTALLTLIETIDATGCSDSIEVVITINLLPTPKISGKFSACATTNEIYSVQEVAGNSYYWTVTGGSIVGSNRLSKITVLWGSGTAGSLSVIQSVRSTGCYDSTKQEIKINPLPTPSITGNNTACVNNSLSIPYSTPSISGMTNRWSVMGGTIDGNMVGNSVFIFWLNAGDNYITMTQTNDTTGCSQTVSYKVVVRDVAKPVIKGKFITCLNSTETYSVVENPTMSYYWIATGGNIIGRDDSTSVNVQWIAQDAGNLRLQLTENTTGCRNSITKDLTINRLPRTNISGPTKACSDKEIIYSLIDTADINASWSITDGRIVAYKSITTVVVVWDKITFGKLSVTATNRKTKCTNSQTYQVTIYNSPKSLFNGPTSVCQNTKAVYVADTTTGIVYAWDVEGSSQIKHISQGKIEVTWTDALTGKVSLTAISGSTCTSVYSQDVKVFPAPQPVIKGDTAVCQGVEATYTTDDQPGINHKWTVANGQISGADNTNTAKVTFTNKGPGSVSISQTFGETGCYTKVTKQINVLEKPAKPVITQNINTLNSSSATGNQWYEKGVKITGATNQNYNASQSGEYSVQTTSLAGCVSDISDIYNFTYTGIEESAYSFDGSSLKISPNPALDNVRIEFDLRIAGSITLSIRNILGEKVSVISDKYYDSGSNELNINVRDLESGVYYCVLTSNKYYLNVKFTIIK